MTAQTRKTFLVRAISFASSLSPTAHTAGASASVFYIAAPSDSHHDRRRHSDNKQRRGNTVRRLRRLEKTVEALSHGLILALTQLKSESGGQSGDVPHVEPYRTARPSSNACDEGEETVPGDAVDALSTALAGMGLSGNSTEQLFAALVTSGRLIMITNVCSAPRSWYATTVAA